MVDPIPMTPSGGEPQSCMQNKNIQKIVSTYYNNLGLSQYYGNYNRWLNQKLKEVKAGKFSLGCSKTIASYQTQADDSILQRAKREKDQEVLL